MEDTDVKTLRISRRLRLERETIAELNSELFSSQGHSLWTCDASARAVPQPPAWFANPAANSGADSSSTMSAATPPRSEAAATGTR